MASRFVRTIAAAAAVLALLSTLIVTISAPADAATRRLVSGWIPYWSIDASLANFQANADVFSDVSPFWHALTGDTTVSDQASSGDRSSVITAARSAGVPLVPAITDGTGTGKLAAALADPARRATIVQTMVNLVTSRGYDGLDLDLEGFAYADPKTTWPTTRPNWVTFVKDLGAALHARGKVLHATIPPTYDSNRSNSSGYWVYDYAGIAPHVDRVRLMAYDYSVGSPGPIAPYNWVQRIVTYAQTQIPRSKLVLGLPAYGRDWPTATTGTCPTGTVVRRTSLTAAAAWDLAKAKRVTVQWDATARERTFTYTDTFSDPTTSCKVTRVVYFSDAAAISDRSRLAYTSQWAGVALWNLGGTDAGTWPALRTLANGLGYPLFAGQVMEVQVAGGSTGVPADAEAVSLNLTVTEPAGAGYLRAWPCGTAMPPTSNVNYVGRQTVADAVLVGVGAGGKVCVFTSTNAHVVVDAGGYFPAGSPYQAQRPSRLLDTRAGSKPTAGSTVSVAVPSGIAAAALSIAVTEPASAGYVGAYPCGTAWPGTSSVNFVAGQTIAASMIAKPGSNGKVCFRISTATHLVVDLMGVLQPGNGFAPLTPTRILDTRLSPGTPVQVLAQTPVATGFAGSAVALNVTATGGSGSGWVQAYPCGTTPPGTSTLNVTAGQTIANSTIVKIGTGGAVCLRSTLRTHLVVDRTSGFTGTGYFTAAAPKRLADTRLP